MLDRAASIKIFPAAVKSLALRFVFYTSVVFALAFILPVVIENEGGSIFLENGLIEWTQFCALVVASLVFAYGAVHIPQFRVIFQILAALPAFAAVRELDSILDKMIPVLGWKVGFVFTLFAAYIALKHRDVLIWQISKFIVSPAFSLLWAGFIVAIPIAQLLGHGPLLKNIMGDNYDSLYKRIIEESGELVGYLLILAGSIESMIFMKSESRKLT